MSNISEEKLDKLRKVMLRVANDMAHGVDMQVLAIPKLYNCTIEANPEVTREYFNCRYGDESKEIINPLDKFTTGELIQEFELRGHTINLLEKFTIGELIQEVQTRGHNVILDDKNFPAITETKEKTRWNALEWK